MLSKVFLFPTVHLKLATLVLQAECSDVFLVAADHSSATLSSCFSLRCTPGPSLTRSGYDEVAKCTECKDFTISIVSAEPDYLSPGLR